MLVPLFTKNESFQRQINEQKGFSTVEIREIDGALEVAGLEILVKDGPPTAPDNNGVEVVELSQPLPVQKVEIF